MSMERPCQIWKATDAKWYLALGDFEHAYEPKDCTCYGPFATEEAACDSLDAFANPGSFGVDESGTAPPPPRPRPVRRRYS